MVFRIIRSFVRRSLVSACLSLDACSFNLCKCRRWIESLNRIFVPAGTEPIDSLTSLHISSWLCGIESKYGGSLLPSIKDLSFHLCLPRSLHKSVFFRQGLGHSKVYWIYTVTWLLAANLSLPNAKCNFCHYWWGELLRICNDKWRRGGWLLKPSRKSTILSKTCQTIDETNDALEYE